MVKTVLDNFCVKTGILCPRCEEKLDKGLVTQLDLKIINLITSLEKEYPVLQDVSFHRAVDVNDTLAILVDNRDMGKFLSYGGKIVRSIGEKVGKRVKLLGHGGDSREFLEELFSPFSILTINTVWLPDGSTETKVILHGRTPKRMPIDIDVVTRLAREIRGLSLRVEFEKS